jgi:hypothetical protein
VIGVAGPGRVYQLRARGTRGSEEAVPMDHPPDETDLAARVELRRRQQDEAAQSWPGLGSVTDAQMKGSIFGIVAGVVVGAVLFLPLALIPWEGMAVGWRLVLAAVCGAVAGAVALAVYFGGREPEREREAEGTPPIHPPT